MRIKNYLWLLAGAAMVASCSSDALEVAENGATKDSRLIELSKGFAISAVGETNTTRTNWAWSQDGSELENVFLPNYTAGTTPSGSVALNTVADANSLQIGLCWIGESVDATVKTNYQFIHYGWLKAGEEVAEVNPCAPYKIENGYEYGDVTLATSSTLADVKPANAFLAFQFPYVGDFATVGGVTPNADGVFENINWNSGVYKTENKSIFGGSYIAYYPYDSTFDEVGSIPVSAETNVKAALSLIDPALAEATFRYSDVAEIEGGNGAAGFNMHNLSGLIQINLVDLTGLLNSNSKKVKNIVLLSDNEFVKETTLDASKIAAGLKGTDLYVADDKHITTNKINIDCGLGILPVLSNADPKALVYVSVLPTTVSDLKVLVGLDDNSWCMYDKGAYTVEAGRMRTLKLQMVLQDFSTDIHYAVDDATLQSELTCIGTTTPGTIQVIGDVVLETANTIIPKNVTVQGGKIIVPQKKVLDVKGKVYSDIEIYGRDCCTSGTVAGGQVWAHSNTTTDPVPVIANVTMFPAENYKPADTDEPTLRMSSASIAKGKAVIAKEGKRNNGPKITVDGAVECKADLVVEPLSSLTVQATGALDINGSNVTNDGVIEVLNLGRFNYLGANGETQLSYGAPFVNNGKFIHNVDAQVGGATQGMTQLGIYMCRVNSQIKLDDAYTKWIACNLIQMVNTTDVRYALNEVKQHANKHIDIEIGNGTDATEATINMTNNGSGGMIAGDNRTIGNLTVNEGSTLNVNPASISVNHTGILTVTGNLTAMKDAIVIINGKDVTTTTSPYGQKQGLTVTGDIVLNPGADKTSNTSFTVSNGTINVKAANYTQYAGSESTFGNREHSSDVNMAITNVIEVKKDATMTISPAVAPKLNADITCKSLVEGGKFTSDAKPRTI